jgi:hypothetical protein
MGKSFLADISGNSWQLNFTNASVASDGANAVIASQAFVAPADIKVKRAWFVPWADQATKGTATTSATYKRVNILNGGTSGTGTTIMASCNLTASVASRGSKAFATTANNTASGGEMLYFSALTVGGTSNDGTILRAGVLQIEYELL